MPIENAKYISDLNTLYPLVNDGITQGDDHIRLEKSVIKNTLPNADGAVLPTSEQFNKIIMKEQNFNRILNPREDDVREPNNIDELITFSDDNVEAQVLGTTFEDGTYDPDDEVPSNKPDNYPDTLNAYDIEQRIEAIENIYKLPVDSVVYTMENINPSLPVDDGGYGYGNWIRIAEGQLLAGIGVNTDRNGLEHTVNNGENLKDSDNNDYTWSSFLTKKQIPNHQHKNDTPMPPLASYRILSKNADVYSDINLDNVKSSGEKTQYTGGSGKHSHTPPIIGIYVWIRTS